MTLYKISDVAREVGVAPGTLRLWEQYGVLTPVRAPSGHRGYSLEQLEAARKIQSMRSTRGLSLAEIKLALGKITTKATIPQLPLENQSPGQALRQMRLERGMSIQALAGELGASVSTISTFERTSRGAGVKFLRAVADYFDVTVTELTARLQSPEAKVVRRTEGQHITTLGKGIDVRALATGRRLMDCKEWALTPGASSNGSYSHAGEEFIYVLSGSILISVDGLGEVLLGSGDSLYFESTRNHSWINRGESDCVVIWINTPASF